MAAPLSPAVAAPQLPTVAAPQLPAVAAPLSPAVAAPLSPAVAGSPVSALHSLVHLSLTKDTAALTSPLISSSAPILIFEEQILSLSESSILPLCSISQTLDPDGA